MAIEPTKESLNELIKEMKNFREFSGLEVNYLKTVAFEIGPCRGSDAKIYTQSMIQWTKDPVKILGIWFHPDRQIMENLNYF